MLSDLRGRRNERDLAGEETLSSGARGNEGGRCSVDERCHVRRTLLYFWRLQRALPRTATAPWDWSRRPARHYRLGRD